MTEEEIKAVESFRESKKSFVYGMVFSSETYFDENREMAGFSVLLCDWLSNLFGYRFEPTVYHWDELLKGFQNQSIDFSGEFSEALERRNNTYMTDPIASRSVKCMRIIGSKPLSEIVKERPLKYVFLKGSDVYEKILPFLRDRYEAVFVNDSVAAHSALITGRGDAFFSEASAEAAFDTYGDIETKDFYPLAYIQVSLATKNSSLEPFISVVQKALKHGAIRHLTDLYNSGMRDYLRHKFFLKLTESENSYISGRVASRRAVPIVSEYNNYPFSFYNSYEKKWQGAAIDVLGEISALTGLIFVRVNDQNSHLSEILTMLRNGEAAMITELIRSDERQGQFLWADVPFSRDYFALLSKENFRNIRLNEILHTKIGLTKDSASANMFNVWFPYHANTVEYDSIEQAFAALDRDEIGMIMATRNSLLVKTNFLEEPGYKLNILFDHSYDAAFGFNINETVLASIVNKALPLIDAEGISRRWLRKTFDYRDKVLRAQLPWLVGAVVLLLFSMSLLIVLLYNRKRENRRLDKLVNERTEELKKQIEATKEADERMRIMLEQSPLVCSLWDEHGVMIDCSMEALKFFGISRKSDYIEHFYDLNPEFQPDGRPTGEKAKELIRSALEKGYEHFDWMYKSASGEELPCETTLVRVQWKDGLRLAAYSRDLREIREAEASTVRMSAIIEASPEFVMCMSPLGVVEYVNQAAADITGYAREEIFVSGLGIMLDEKSMRRLNEESMPAVSGGKKIAIENIITRKDGEKRVLMAVLFPIAFQDGNIGVAMTAKDITDIKKMYQDLLESKERAERALRQEQIEGDLREDPVKYKELDQIDFMVDYITKNIGSEQ
ncbi:MAG: transporter substrate-binding domain-containing protein [Desulfovibrio sp.]|nr:transporter substrate-binding domain-containing protein [Desulfovibrio sp.]